MAAMRLSEAIRLGSLLRGQAFCEYMTVLEPVRSCALGAALEAMGVDGLTGSREVQRIWPWTVDVCRYVGNCPVCLELKIQHGWPVLSIITHLNDKHQWTREAIADWVEAIEPKEAGPDRDRVSEEQKEAVCV